MKTQRQHFETFDALRFLAFFCVFLQHIPIPNSRWFSILNHSGTIGVRFFFVLSGFLISYILLYEKQAAKEINLKNFFVRRILRIWPLFYAMILFAFLTPTILEILNLSSSSDGYQPNYLLSCLFLENYQMMFSHNVPNVSPLVVMWSLCVEEHFYILWGILVFWLPAKWFPNLIIGGILVGNLSRIIYANLGLDFLDLPTNIDFFAYGAIPAYCILYKQNAISKLGHLQFWIKYLVVFAAVGYSFAAPNLDYAFQKLIDPAVFGLLFMSVLFFTLPQTNRIFVGRKNILSRLGLYTYGLYLFHTIVINLVLRLKGFTTEISISATIALALTIILSLLSYYLFESKFLALKKYFSGRMLSGFADSEQN